MRDWECADGQCINGAKRCDGTADCGDGSDEEPAMCDLGLSRNFLLSKLAENGAMQQTDRNFLAAFP